jgi:hypothetical protein
MPKMKPMAMRIKSGGPVSSLLCEPAIARIREASIKIPAAKLSNFAKRWKLVAARLFIDYPAITTDRLLRTCTAQPSMEGWFNGGTVT